MCCCNDKKEGCRKPENLKGKPEDCSPEQIRKCHGDVKKHSCLAKGDREGRHS
jgi:hypothetical protein